MIEEIPIAKLDPRQIKQLESAEEAAQTNPTYALEIYGAILKQNQRITLKQTCATKQTNLSDLYF